MTLNKAPIYNLKAVLQETDLAADTLRAWERRYGLPMPQRTAGGHRLYSQYDIETIKWLVARQAEGFSISRAVDLWNEKIAAGEDPFISVAPSSTLMVPAPAFFASSDTTLTSLRAEWISACLKFSETTAEQVLNQAFSMFPVEAVCLEVLQKGMSEMGMLWYENRVSVQQEHFASGLAMRRLDALLSAAPAPSRNQTVLIGCPSNEWHVFTALLLTLILRRRGLSVIYLGANVPADQFKETVIAVRADLVILVAQTLISAATLQTVNNALLNLDTNIGFGGRIFTMLPDLTNKIPGTYLGQSIESSVEQIEKLLRTKLPAPKFESAPQSFEIAHKAFSAQRVHIESTVLEGFRKFGIDADNINTGIQFLGDNILAALQLGDMNFVSLEMEWVKTLMQSQKRPSNELAQFMQMYSQAVDKHINGRGEPIKAWFKSQVELIQA